MQLSRTTPCNLFKIASPRWKERAVGLDKNKVGTHNEIQITYRNKNGDLLYPNSFYISGDNVRKHELQPIPNYSSVQVYIVPISNMEVLERI